MSDSPETELDPTTREIYDLLRRQPGDSFSPRDIAAQLGYDAPEIESHLTQLEQLGLIERAGAGDQATFIVSPGAPEL